MGYFNIAVRVCSSVNWMEYYSLHVEHSCDKNIMAWKILGQKFPVMCETGSVHILLQSLDPSWVLPFDFWSSLYIFLEKWPWVQGDDLDMIREILWFQELVSSPFLTTAPLPLPPFKYSSSALVQILFLMFWNWRATCMMQSHFDFNVHFVF